MNAPGQSEPGLIDPLRIQASELVSHPAKKNGILHWAQQTNDRLESEEDIKIDSDDEDSGQPNDPSRNKLIGSKTIGQKSCTYSQELSCLTMTQIITEFLIILFALSLLLLAAAIIFNDRIPAIINSSDLIPKVLFVLCAIVAICSFSKWLLRKIRQRFTRSSDKRRRPTIEEGLRVQLMGTARLLPERVRSTAIEKSSFPIPIAIPMKCPHIEVDVISKGSLERGRIIPRFRPDEQSKRMLNGSQKKLVKACGTERAEINLE